MEILILKFIWNFEELRISKAILKMKNKDTYILLLYNPLWSHSTQDNVVLARGSTHSGIEYRAQENTHIYAVSKLWNRNQSYLMKKRIPFQKRVWNCQMSLWKKWTSIPIIYHTKFKISSRCMVAINIKKAKAIKLLEKNRFWGVDKSFLGHRK